MFSTAFACNWNYANSVLVQVHKKRLASSYRICYLLCLCVLGVLQEKMDYGALIHELGGEYIELDYYTNHCTHLVTGECLLPISTNCYNSFVL